MAVDYDHPAVVERRRTTEEEMKGQGGWKNLPKGLCATCDNESNPVPHFGSPMCKSRGMGAQGGNRAHCTCDSCF